MWVSGNLSGESPRESEGLRWLSLSENSTTRSKSPSRSRATRRRERILSAREDFEEPLPPVPPHQTPNTPRTPKFQNLQALNGWLRWRVYAHLRCCGAAESSTDLESGCCVPSNNCCLKLERVRGGGDIRACSAEPRRCCERSTTLQCRPPCDVVRTNMQMDRRWIALLQGKKTCGSRGSALPLSNCQSHQSAAWEIKSRRIHNSTLSSRLSLQPYRRGLLLTPLSRSGEHQLHPSFNYLSSAVKMILQTTQKHCCR